MRIRFFVTLLMLLIALVIQVKWGSWSVFSGAPLVLGSLVLAGTFLDWDGVLFLSLLAVWVMSTQQGITPEMLLLVAVPFAAWGIKRITAPSVSRIFIYVRKDLIAPVIAICAVLIFIYVSAFSVSTLPSPGMLIAAALATLLWCTLGVYVFEFLE